MRLATDTLTHDAEQLGTTSAQLQQISIYAHASIIWQPQPQLWLTYHIQLPCEYLAEKLSWPCWDKEQIEFTDYLWEHTCLECFIAGNAKDSHQTDSYIEINACPSGRYAIYQFEHYRYPSTLPPIPLRQTNHQSRAYINWSDVLTELKTAKYFLITKPVLPFANLVTLSFRPHYHYQRRFGLPLKHLPSSFFTDNCLSSVAIKSLHPCVILRFDQTTLYFAPTHTSPPDFHKQSHWSTVNYSSATYEQKI